eukprot:9367295-Pyramimonas_sp.AAC.1
MDGDIEQQQQEGADFGRRGRGRRADEDEVGRREAKNMEGEGTGVEEGEVDGSAGVELEDGLAGGGRGSGGRISRRKK